MRIGFDGKRAFHNTTGLGNYSRTLIDSLAANYAHHHYYLYNPKPSLKYARPDYDNVFEMQPSGLFSKKMPSYWRSVLLTGELKKNQLDVYHGLSHELPKGIRNSGIPSVVTIHDLIYELYPKQFNRIDTSIYRSKYRYACKNADHIIAISNNTKADIIRLYGIDDAKISVCYQACQPIFQQVLKASVMEACRIKYKLPAAYFLYVGSIIPRRNLLGICKAMKIHGSHNNIPLLVVGMGGKHKKEVEVFIQENGLENRIHFFSDADHAKNNEAFESPEILPAIYQMAKALIYPSFYEGFGLPVLEALWSRVPVITSSVSCLPEAGGDAAYSVDPGNPQEIASAMEWICNNPVENNRRIDLGLKYAQNFTVNKASESVMQVYEKLING